MTKSIEHKEIERKFLIRHLPNNLEKYPTASIKQGYVIQCDNRELRVRHKNTKWLLTVKDGSGIQRSEVEFEITESQGQALWDMTTGRRVVKTRYKYPVGKYCMEIDVFKDGLAPLQLCEVEFPSLEEAKAFSPPDFVGKEVTKTPEYRNFNLAMHGLPSKRKSQIRLGTMPFLMKNDKLHLVLVKNRSGSKWILPKGQAEDDLTRPEVAMLEAFEEAGVVGRLTPGIRGQCRIQDSYTLHIYPLKVVTILKKWPESSFRKRAVVKYEKALSMLDDPEIVRCVKRLKQRVFNENR